MSRKSVKKKNVIIIILAIIIIFSVAFTIWTLRKKVEPPADQDSDFLVTGLEEDIHRDSASQGKPEGVDLFFDEFFLNIQQSLIEHGDLNAPPQVKADFWLDVTAPQNVQVRDAHNGKAIVLTWDLFATPPEKIKILRSSSSGILGAEIAELSGDEVGYYDFDVEIGKIYYYSVLSVDSFGGESAHAGPYPIGPIEDLLPLLAPFSPRVMESEDRVVITWQDPLGEDFDYINIYRSEEKGLLGQNLVQIFKGVEEYIDFEIQAGVKYYYLLTSVDINGNESEFNLGIDVQEIGNPNPFLPFHKENSSS